ncbi:hypothetical protein WDU94_009205, partial [Cyamophila willieti]
NLISFVFCSQAESEISCPGDETARLTIEGDDAQEDDVLSYCEYNEIPPPPDGGYGWVIVIASFLCNMIVDGIAYTFGVFLNEFVRAFDEGKGKTAWVGSLLSGMYLSCGPVVSALANKFGCRTVCIAGSIIGCAAFALSTLCQNVNQLMLVYGVMGGIGFGLIYLPAVVCVGYYFETKRSLATGIAVCGSGFGTFAFAPFAAYLLSEFDWKGANLILAGLILNCAIFGALMRPLEANRSSSHKPLLQRMADEKRFQMERGSIGGSYFIVQLPDGSMEKRMKMPINVDPGVHSSFNLDQLVPGTPITPVPTMAVLPTITEVKAPEQSGSSNNSNTSSAAELKNDKKKDIKIQEGVEEVKEEEDVKDSEEPSEEVESPVDDVDEKKEVKSSIPRNASQPAFTTHVQGLHKNGSVPNFDRIRKTSASERYRPTLGPIKVSKPNVNSNGDLRKSLHLRLSNANIGGSRNNTNDENMWSKTDIDQDGVSFSASKQSIRQPKKDYIRPMARKDIFYSGSIVNLPEYQSQKSLTTYRQSVMSIPRYSRSAVNIDTADQDIEKEGGDDCSCCALPESFKSVLGSMMDVSLLKDPVFMLIGVSNIFGMAGLYVPFVYLVDAASVAGIESNKASFLLSIIGITNTFGRVIFGYIADFPSVNSLLLNNLCLVVCTISVGAIPICSSYFHYVIVAVFFGTAVSGYISLTSIILVDLLGLDKLTNAFGLLILFRGAAAIVGSPLAGAVYDATNSYDIPFYMAATFFLFSTITSFMAPYMKQCTSKEEILPIVDALTPIDEDEELEAEEEEEEMDDDNVVPIPEIVETMPSPMNNEMKSPPKEIKQIESVL